MLPGKLQRSQQVTRIFLSIQFKKNRRDTPEIYSKLEVEEMLLGFSSQ